MSSKIDTTSTHLMSLLDAYKDDIEQAPSRLTLKGKTLEAANKEQVTWLAFYSERKAEVKRVVKRFQALVEQVRGNLFQQYTETYSRALTERAKDKYIDKDDEYLEMYEKQLIAEEMYDKLSAIVDSFVARGFALRNLVELKVNDIQDYTL